MEVHLNWEWWEAALFVAIIILANRIGRKNAIGILKRALKKWLDND